MLADAADRARRYLRLVADRAVAPSPAAVLALDEMDFPLPVAGIEPSRVLAMLDDAGSPATVASAGPRYFGFVVGGALPVAVPAPAAPESRGAAATRPQPPGACESYAERPDHLA